MNNEIPVDDAGEIVRPKLVHDKVLPLFGSIFIVFIILVIITAFFILFIINYSKTKPPTAIYQPEISPLPTVSPTLGSDFSSKWATDAAILKIKGNLASLSAEINKIDFSEEKLTIPVFDLNIAIKEK